MYMLYDHGTQRGIFVLIRPICILVIGVRIWILIIPELGMLVSKIILDWCDNSYSRCCNSEWCLSFSALLLGYNRFCRFGFVCGFGGRYGEELIIDRDASLSEAYADP